MCVQGDNIKLKKKPKEEKRYRAKQSIVGEKGPSYGTGKEGERLSVHTEKGPDERHYRGKNLAIRDTLSKKEKNENYRAATTGSSANDRRPSNPQ